MGRDRSLDLLWRFERTYGAYLRKVRRAVATEDFTVADMRVIDELGLAKGCGSGAWLADNLALDTGYVCRILKKLQAYGLVTPRASDHDRRMREWALTKQGQAFAESIEREHREHARGALEGLDAGEERRLVDAMKTIEEILSADTRRRLTRG